MFPSSSVSFYDSDKAVWDLGEGANHFNLCTVGHPGPQHVLSFLYLSGSCLKYGHANLRSAVFLARLLPFLSPKLPSPRSSAPSSSLSISCLFWPPMGCWFPDLPLLVDGLSGWCEPLPFPESWPNSSWARVAWKASLKTAIPISTSSLFLRSRALSCGQSGSGLVGGLSKSDKFMSLLMTLEQLSSLVSESPASSASSAAALAVLSPDFTEGVELHGEDRLFQHGLNLVLEHEIAKGGSAERGVWVVACDGVNGLRTHLWRAFVCLFSVPGLTTVDVTDTVVAYHHRKQTCLVTER